jgi:predicted  nucleic acid-binding Zn-ribbon protein
MKDRPEALQREEQNLVAAKASLDATMANIKALQMIVDRRQVELQAAEGAMAKMNVQLNNLKTNAEYAAMQKQIDAKDEEKRTQEDRILEAMEVVENARSGIPERKAAVAATEAKLTQAKQQLAIDLKGLEALLAKELRAAEELSKHFPDDVLKTYRFQLNRYGKDALTIVDAAGICQGCHTKTTSQVGNQAVAGHVIQCNNCERLIYMPL